MFDEYIEFNEENMDLLFVNGVVENLKYGLISLDTMFRGEVADSFYHDEYTFFFFHMQSVLTAQGNIWNILFNTYPRNREISMERVEKMRDKLKIDFAKYPLIRNKVFRNTNEHFDERYYHYEKISLGIGDYNILRATTPDWIRQEILSTPHLRTIDIQNWQYISYDHKGNRHILDLRELKKEMYSMLVDLSECDVIFPTHRNNSLKEMLKVGCDYAF